MALSDALRKQISDTLARNRVVLFMKGPRGAPACGFSATVVQILDGLGADYETVNVLSSPELRDGIKEFSQWPTIPQLFVDKTLVGGCDIVREMAGSGELQKLVGAGDAPKAPSITITEGAAKAFASAAGESDGQPLRLQIDGQYRYELFFGPSEPGDVVVQAGGQTVALDRASARRADGLSIDYVGGNGGGFKITNPNEPARVKSLSARELKNLLDQGEKIELFDVRGDRERDVAKIEAARQLDEEGQEYLLSLPKNARIVFHCHHGMRSRAAAERAILEGFTDVSNLEGGIDAWSQTVDPDVSRY